MKIFFSRTFAVAVVLVLTATGLWVSPAGEEEPAAAMEKEMVLDPSTGKMVSAPEYGGTLTVANLLEPENADMHFSHVPALVSGATVEKLGMMDWAIDRDMFSFSSHASPTQGTQ